MHIVISYGKYKVYSSFLIYAALGKNLAKIIRTVQVSLLKIKSTGN